jgi:hypothetical protein
MKLSDAIRLGAMLKPQGFGCWTAAANAPASCALGAAYDALGMFGEGVRLWEVLAKRYPVLRAMNLMACPACGATEIGSMVPHVNDSHGWTREQIADWVATIEAQQEQPTEQPQPVSVEV